MIFGNCNHLENFNLSADIMKCFKYFQENDLANKKAGSYEIDGRRIFVNIDEYTTQIQEERFWEAHRKYLDVHVLLKGEEQIDITFLHNMQQNPYDEEKDFLTLEGNKQGSIYLQEIGDFLVCYPQDVHRTAVKITEKTAVKKCIFKIAIA